MKCSVEVAAGVFARFSCRHSWNLRLRLTESDNHRPANTIDVLIPKLSMLKLAFINCNVSHGGENVHAAT